MRIIKQIAGGLGFAWIMYNALNNTLIPILLHLHNTSAHGTDSIFTQNYITIINSEIILNDDRGPSHLTQMIIKENLNRIRWNKT